MSLPRGRRDGPPSSTTTAPPTTQPMSTERTVSNETGAVTSLVKANPNTRTQPNRRHVRVSHGAAAVTAAAAAAMP